MKDKSLNVARTARVSGRGKQAGRWPGSENSRRISHYLDGAGVHRGSTEFWGAFVPMCASTQSKWAGEILEKKLIWWLLYKKSIWRNSKREKGNKLKEKCKASLDGKHGEREKTSMLEGQLESKQKLLMQLFCCLHINAGFLSASASNFLLNIYVNYLWNNEQTCPNGILDSHLWWDTSIFFSVHFYVICVFINYILLYNEMKPEKLSEQG